MAFSGIQLPGIVSPDESVEQFAKLYGNGNVGKMMMIMASTIGNPYGLPAKPYPSVLQSTQLKDNRPVGYYSNVNRPGYVEDRNLPMNRYRSGVQTMRHGGYGDHYNPSPAMRHGGHGDHCHPSPAVAHHNPRYTHQGVQHQQEGFVHPRSLQRSRPTRPGGYGDHYNRSPVMEHHKPEYCSRYGQQGVQHRQYPVAAHQNQYIFSAPTEPPYPWL